MRKKLELKTYPDNCLRVKTKDVCEISDELKGIVQDMADIMYLNQGVGLAATQVGLDIRLLTIDIGEGLLTFINPEIVEVSKKCDVMGEGCLSLPGVTVHVARPEKIKLKKKDLKGKEETKTYEGFLAKVILHEMDHLEGRLLIDYLNPVKRWMSVASLRKTKKLKRM